MAEDENIHGSFMDENARCPECGMFPPDHDPVCPHNPALHAISPTDALRELEEKLKELECSDMPDFDAITDLLARIESVRSNVRSGEDSS